MRWLFVLYDAISRSLRTAWTLTRRYPVVAIPTILTVAILLPLARDWINAIPWYVRNAVGSVVFSGVVALGLRRLWRLRTDDDRLPSTVPGESWIAAVLSLLLCALLTIPLLSHPENLGAGDWDLFLARYESIRRSIVEWGQFPWWDPWIRGGFPLAASPHCGVVSVATPFVLVFGTSVGLRLAAVACMIIATEGARRLARLWIGDPWAATAAGLIYGMNGAVMLQAVAGYHLVMSYCAFPWLLVHAFRLERSALEGVGLGFWMAFNLCNGINYYSVYGVLVLGVVSLRVLRVRQGVDRTRLLLHAVLAIGVMLLLCGWRLGTTGAVYRDFPRNYFSGWSETPWSMLIHLLNRPSAEAARSDKVYFWETTCYVGPVVLGLALLSLRNGWRWWHTLAAVSAALASGCLAWYQPSYWLSSVPLFSSMHVVTRWRVIAMLGVGMAVADLLARWRTSDSKTLQRVAVLAIAVIAIDFVQLGFVVLPQAFRLPPTESRFPGPPTDQLVQIDEWPAFPALLRGYGVIATAEPLLGYDQRAVTSRKAVGKPDYRGEFWTEAGAVRPRYWSPNRIVLQVKPGELVSVNQNPGSYWWINGQPVFNSMRCAEIRQDFEARADASGQLVLQIQPKGLEAGLKLHMLGGVISVLAVAGLWFARGVQRTSDGVATKATKESAPDLLPG